MTNSYRVIDGILSPARFQLSPNQDERPEGQYVDLLVIHNISLPPGQFGGPFIEELFCNNLNPQDHVYFKDIYQLRVSAHLLIRRSGEVIQFVPFNRRAWHAGQSCYRGRSRCNDFSIGVELEGTDQLTFTDVQYTELGKITLSLMASYPSLTIDRICGHQHIAPERKTDPGPCFDWRRYFERLQKRE